MAFQFTKERFLLCEGSDDKSFFEVLIETRELPEFQVCQTAETNRDQVGGIPGFQKALEKRGLEVISGFNEVKAFLFVVDNDFVNDSFSSLQRIVRSNGYTPPESPNKVGCLGGKPLAFLLVPNDRDKGGLEKLCLPAIYDKWPTAKDCVDNFLNCTGATSWSKGSSICKAQARAAIVGFNEDDPFKGIGHLLRQDVLSVRHQHFNQIYEFLSDFDRFVAG
ncbi:MAG: DUF3226 domain-containing protein [Leptospirales bacterium]